MFEKYQEGETLKVAPNKQKQILNKNRYIKNIRKVHDNFKSTNKKFKPLTEATSTPKKTIVSLRNV